MNNDIQLLHGKISVTNALHSSYCIFSKVFPSIGNVKIEVCLVE